MQNFKELVCESGGFYIEDNCEHIYVHVQSATNWADITPTRLRRKRTNDAAVEHDRSSC